MSKKELTKWFWDKFNSCYPVQHKEYKENYFLYYDPQFIRQIKLCKIIDEEIKYPKKPSGKILFYLDFKNKYLYCDYKEIWSFFESNYSSNHNEIRDLISGMLEVHDKLNVFTPDSISRFYHR